MKNAQILELVEQVKSFQSKEKPMPVLFSYALIKNIKTLEAEKESIIAAHDKLLEECLDRDDEGNLVEGENGRGYKIKDDKIDYYREEYNKLMNEDIEIYMKTFDIKSLDGVELTINDMAAIEFMLEDE